MRSRNKRRKQREYILITIILNQAWPVGDRNPSAATENRKCRVNGGEGRRVREENRKTEERKRERFDLDVWKRPANQGGGRET